MSSRHRARIGWTEPTPTFAGSREAGPSADPSPRQAARVGGRAPRSACEMDDGRALIVRARLRGAAQAAASAFAEPDSRPLKRRVPSPSRYQPTSGRVARGRCSSSSRAGSDASGRSSCPSSGRFSCWPCSTSSDQRRWTRDDSRDRGRPGRLNGVAERAAPAAVTEGGSPSCAAPFASCAGSRRRLRTNAPTAARAAKQDDEGDGHTGRLGEQSRCGDRADERRGRGQQGEQHVLRPDFRLGRDGGRGAMVPAPSGARSGASHP